MASILQPHIQAFVPGGTIVAGHAVKFGVDYKTVVECTAASDKSIGIAVGSAASTDDRVEVYLAGGGAKPVAQTTVALGDVLVSHTDGTLKPSTTTGDRIVAVAMQDAVAGDVFAAVIQLGLHY